MDSLKAYDLMQGSVQSRDFNEITKWLRSADEERLEFMLSCLGTNAGSRLCLAVSKTKEENLTVLNAAFDLIITANSQLTKSWTEFGIKKLGVKSFIKCLDERVVSQPHVVDMAAYWMPTFIDKKSPDFQLSLEYSQKMQSSNIIKPTKQHELPDGKVVFSDRYK